MKQLFLAALAGALLVLTGCPLQTAEPVDNGSYTATGWLMGTWTQQKPDGTAGKAYVIKKGDKPGHIQVYSVVGGEPEKKFRPVVMSSVGAKIFVSAYDEGDDIDEKGYYIYQIIRKGNGEFDLLPVKEHSVGSEADSLELRNWLSDHAGEDIYEAGEMEHYKKG